jgi:hypothetical protein
VVILVVSLVVKAGQYFLWLVLVGSFVEYPVCGRRKHRHARGFLHAAFLSASDSKAVVPYMDWYRPRCIFCNLFSLRRALRSVLPGESS